jgi:hypothetical protein
MLMATTKENYNPSLSKMENECVNLRTFDKSWHQIAGFKIMIDQMNKHVELPTAQFYSNSLLYSESTM